MATPFYDHVVIGGGIAGTTCAEHLSRLTTGRRIALVSATDLLKSVGRIKKLSKTLEEFEIVERPSAAVQIPNVEVVRAGVAGVDTAGKTVRTDDGRVLRYGRLCLCTGAAPKVVAAHRDVLGIRDTESVHDLKRRLSTARRVVVLGNGGIALELVFEVECDVVWAIKDAFLGNTFFDEASSAFLLPTLFRDLLAARNDGDPQPAVSAETSDGPLPDAGASPPSARAPQGAVAGSALGPEWTAQIRGAGAHTRKVTVEINCEFVEVETHSGTGVEWPLTVVLTNGKRIDCDFVVSATGVVPRTDLVGPEVARSPVDGGIVVNEQMETSVPDLYAAGDCATAGWDPAPQWFQMRLWTQAKQMGLTAAQAMAGAEDELAASFSYELFAHTTRFFGFKVILLGKYNAQGLCAGEYEEHSRCIPDTEYVKIILANGRMQGALLIGDTDLEETFENLILNGLDLSRYGAQLLDPDVDLEDFFD